jgi:hypothetical protein
MCCAVSRRARTDCALTLLCARQDHNSASSGLCTRRASSSAAMLAKCFEQVSHGKKLSMKPLHRVNTLLYGGTQSYRA